MAEPRPIAPGAGELIGDSPDRRVEILVEDDALHVTWSRFAAGRAGADPHVHRHHTDFFYVLAGELTVIVDDAELVAPAGSLARLPPLVVHGFRNAGDAEVRYLNLHAPGCGFADYMRGLRDGRATDFDQQEPPPVSDRRPAHAATIGPPEDTPELTFALLDAVDPGARWVFATEAPARYLAVDLP